MEVHQPQTVMCKIIIVTACILTPCKQLEHLNLELQKLNRCMMQLPAVGPASISESAVMTDLG